jgi:hypothetical protein
MPVASQHHLVRVTNPRQEEEKRKKILTQPHTRRGEDKEDIKAFQ